MVVPKSSLAKRGRGTVRAANGGGGVSAYVSLAASSPFVTVAPRHLPLAGRDWKPSAAGITSLPLRVFALSRDQKSLAA
ncbi:hypothetical protein GGR47_001092 [Sphingomonas aquatilis]|uniref:Uncharacterized protein n=1 Tax=Sphingomonas aquatilis TaxID=93063 RepID=A0AAW3TP87_9SPHN|nr:hypothetical protein [Sphingomonas aquatilis]